MCVCVYVNCVYICESRWRGECESEGEFKVEVNLGGKQVTCPRPPPHRSWIEIRGSIAEWRIDSGGGGGVSPGREVNLQMSHSVSNYPPLLSPPFSLSLVFGFYFYCPNHFLFQCTPPPFTSPIQSIHSIEIKSFSCL